MYGLCGAVKTLVDSTLTLASSTQQFDLCATLTESPGKYTRLMLSTGVGYEEFTVTCVGGCLKLSPEPRAAFASGDKVWYESCSAANIEDTIKCLNEEGDVDTDTTLKIDGMVREVDEDGNVCYVPDPELKKPVTFQVGKDLITIDGNGCPSTEGAPSGTVLTPGEYPYATVIVGENCQITGVRVGTKPVCGSCGCCCGDSKSTEAITEAGVVQ